MLPKEKLLIQYSYYMNLQICFNEAFLPTKYFLSAWEKNHSALIFYADSYVTNNHNNVT